MFTGISYTWFSHKTLFTGVIIIVGSYSALSQMNPGERERREGGGERGGEGVERQRGGGRSESERERMRQARVGGGRRGKGERETETEKERGRKGKENQG